MGLQQDYNDVVEAAKKNGINLTHVHEQDGKLVVTGDAPYALDRDRVWDVIKKHPNWQKETAVEFKVASSDVYGMWKVQAGDSLSKIARDVYGDMKQYHRIFEANRDQLTDADHVKTGQTLKIPNKPAAAGA
jgi:nucleoid-associated protein YgaU